MLPRGQASHTLLTKRFVACSPIFKRLIFKAYSSLQIWRDLVTIFGIAQGMNNYNDNFQAERG